MKCKVDGCNKERYRSATPPFKERSYCSHHWYMKYRYGDPLVTPLPRGRKVGFRQSAATKAQISDSLVEAWQRRR